MMAKAQAQDLYARASATAQQVREVVADQLHDLVIERDAMGSYGEVVQFVHQLGRSMKDVGEARGRQKQAAELGLPLAPSVEAEKEAKQLLRQATIGLGAACGAYAAAMDFDELRGLDRDLSAPAAVPEPAE